MHDVQYTFYFVFFTHFFMDALNHLVAWLIWIWYPSQALYTFAIKYFLRSWPVNSCLCKEPSICDIFCTQCCLCCIFWRLQMLWHLCLTLRKVAHFSACLSSLFLSFCYSWYLTDFLTHDKFSFLCFFSTLFSLGLWMESYF